MPWLERRAVGVNRWFAIGLIVFGLLWPLLLFDELPWQAVGIISGWVMWNGWMAATLWKQADDIDRKRSAPDIRIEIAEMSPELRRIAELQAEMIARHLREKRPGKSWYQA